MYETIRLRHSSMQFSDTLRQAAADFASAIPVSTERDAPHFIGFTELNRPIKLLAIARCRKAGYLLHTRSTVGIAVHPSIKVLELGGVDVLDGQSIGKGSYSDRGICEVTGRTRLGNIVTVHEAHWITGPDPSNLRREARRQEQSEMMAERVALHGRGRRLSFWMGDTNSDDNPGVQRDEVQGPLHKAGLISVYDELGEHPATHGRSSTIDIIGSYGPDTRVSARSVEVGKRRNSDHKQVDAVYRVRV